MSSTLTLGCSTHELGSVPRKKPLCAAAQDDLGGLVFAVCFSFVDGPLLSKWSTAQGMEVVLNHNYHNSDNSALMQARRQDA